MLSDTCTVVCWSVRTDPIRKASNNGMCVDVDINCSNSNVWAGRKIALSWPTVRFLSRGQDKGNRRER